MNQSNTVGFDNASTEASTKASLTDKSSPVVDSAINSVCKFCEKALPDPRHFISIESVSFPVCCPGCKKAASLVHGIDLENDGGHGSTADKSANIDKLEFQVNTKTLDTDRFSISLLVPDIRCAACTWLIEKELRQRTGIIAVKTNLSEKRLCVEFSGETSVGDIISLVKSLGYTVRPDQTDELEMALKVERQGLLSRLGVAGIGMMQVMMFAIATYVAGPEGMEAAYSALFRWASLAIATPVALYSASLFHQGAYRDLRHGSLGMDVPVSLAILAAYALSLFNTLTHHPEVYFDSVCMFTFFLLVGRFIEFGSCSRFQRSRDLTEHLVPEVARTSLNPEEFSPVLKLAVGSIVYVESGEAIPADGMVISGESSADESAFTGEVIPVVKGEGSRVMAGSVNLDGLLAIEILVPFSEFVISRVSDLYQQSTLYKPPFSILADKIARYFVGTILLLAAASGLYWYLQGSTTWMVVSLTVLVVSCPCALSLATPVAYTIAATTLRKQGIVVSNGAFLERLAGITAIAFDKTGTLTEGNLKIVEVRLLSGMLEKEAMNIAASLEKISKHPIAAAFGSATLNVEESQIVPGQGVLGIIEGKRYRLGKAAFAQPTSMTNPDDEGMWVLLASDKPLAWFRFEDSPRNEAAGVVKALKNLGYESCLLTGDSSRQGALLGRVLGIEDVRMGLSPEDKVNVLSEKQQQGERVLMVGDGINDTAAMGISDASIAVSPVDIFVQTSADATLLSNNLQSIIVALKFSKRIRHIISQNITWAVLYNLCVIPLAVAGIIEPWMAALGMSLSSVMVILNSNRLMRIA